MNNRIYRVFPYILLLALLLLACAGSASQAGSQGLVTNSATVSTPPLTVVPEANSVAAAPEQTSSSTANSGLAISCTSPASLTVALTEGPYFKANTPERASLIDANTTGQKLTVSGYVLDGDCLPVANARIEVWQANAQGQYDNTGYTLRGHLFTDANGHYQFETIVPGLYPGRTEHIHIKVQAPNGPELTTQLFFPGVASNDSDGIFDPSMVLDIHQATDGLTAQFNFIIATK